MNSNKKEEHHLIKHNFVGLRFFLVPVKESLFTKPAENQQKLSWFIESFLQNKDYNIKQNMEFAIRITQSDGAMYFGKISRKRIFDIREKTPLDIEDKKEEDWPYLQFICNTDLSVQLLVIEHKTNFGFSIDILAKVLAELANQSLFKYGYAATFEPIVSEKEFWHIVEEAEGIYSLTFHLTSPNLFGASSKANEGLRDLQKLYNNNRVSISLYNDMANLKIPKDLIDSYREYADEGGGDWKITTKKARGKRTHKSADKARKITLESESDESSFEILKEAMQQLLRLMRR